MENQTLFGRTLLVRNIILMATILVIVAILAALSWDGARMIPPPADTDGFWRSFTLSFLRSGLSSFSGGLIVGTLVALTFGVYIFAKVSKRPVVIIEDERLRLPRAGIALRWDGVGGFTKGRMFGTPLVGVSTLNDDALMRAVSPLNRLVFRLRIHACGAPFTIPPVREMSLDELYALLEERRQAAIAKSA
jgi:hypothetical protein